MEDEPETFFVEDIGDVSVNVGGYEGTIRAIPREFRMREMSTQEREKALEYAHILSKKINERLEADFPISTNFTSSHVNLSIMQGGTSNIRRLASIGHNNILTDVRVIYPVYGEEDAMFVSEEEVIERAVSIIKADIVYSNSVVAKKLDTLNDNFSRLFEFLKESVELVPGGDEAKRLSENFMEKSLEQNT